MSGRISATALAVIEINHRRGTPQFKTLFSRIEVIVSLCRLFIRCIAAVCVADGANCWPEADEPDLHVAQSPFYLASKRWG